MSSQLPTNKKRKFGEHIQNDDVNGSKQKIWESARYGDVNGLMDLIQAAKGN